MDKEKLLFEMYKDKPIKSIKIFKTIMHEKYKIENSTNLYAKINNYQIEKYGTNLRDRINRMTHREKLHANAKANARKYSKRKNREKK